MTQNGPLPDYLLIADDTGQWHLTASNGELLLEKVTNPDTLAAMLREAGAKFQIIDPKQHIAQTKGNPQ